ncbi:peptidoglycan-associated lipoprotein Pal [Formicincola oecophyllae]|uniref:Peptidoglycan-associated lipoprotein Pal n=2 Tax=Formicincola oecophyllae TaxID=2558361 RepID=A0A4Y6UD61_9PROT|nr:peptidoglycan-associated lipoprotein Pal [Formicincola oecophyllae]
MGLLAACGGPDNNGAGTGASNGAGNGMGNGGISASSMGGPGSQSDLAATAGDRVYFPLNQNDLTADARATLNKQAAWLAKYPQVNVQIAGNCDDRGTEEYNIALGQRRANAVRDYLEAQGVPENRMSTISYGKDRPAVDGDTESAWAQDRNAITNVE